jgi:hypothetical protein
MTGVLPAAFKAIAYPLGKRHNRDFNRGLSIFPPSRAEAKLFRAMVDACRKRALRNCNMDEAFTLSPRNSDGIRFLRCSTY